MCYLFPFAFISSAFSYSFSPKISFPFFSFDLVNFPTQDAWNTTMSLYDNPHFEMGSSLYKGKIMSNGGTTEGLFGCSPLKQGPGCLSSNHIFQDAKFSNCSDLSHMASFDSMGPISFGSPNPDTKGHPSNCV